MREEVQTILFQGFQSWAREQGNPPPEGMAASVESPPGNVAGDLASNLPMAAAKWAKRAPRDVAKELIARLPAQDVVERVEIAGPGFLNFFLKPSWLAGELRSLLSKRGAYGRRAGGGKRTLVEFVSANPNGPLHVGHGRGAALGDSLARILRHLGHDVSTEYYVNDMGNQMENLGASVMWRCGELAPESLDDAEKTFVAGKKPEDLYKGDYIRDIARELLAEFPDRAARPKGWEFFKERAIVRILGSIRGDLEAFGVEMQTWFRESDLHKRGAVDKALAKLKTAGHLKEEEGALWFLSTAFGDDKDRVLKRSDERPTYFASDIAYHAHKLDRNFEKLVDIWGTDHHGYVARLKAAVSALGGGPDALTIVLYQLVSLMRGGQPVAMSTRTGEFVTLREVLDEVGRDACRFFFALRGPDSHLEFDLDLAKKQAPENPVFRVQYVHARCCSLFREAAKRGATVSGLEIEPVPAELDPRERGLLVRLASFPDAVEQCGRDLSPHHLTAYLLNLAGEYHRFYETCRVLGEPGGREPFRLALVDGVRTVIKSG
ncbi:MAG: arginine--tRNA ligase, partial [Elusimicrobiota bacterium]